MLTNLDNFTKNAIEDNCHFEIYIDGLGTINESGEVKDLENEHIEIWNKRKEILEFVRHLVKDSYCIPDKNGIDFSVYIPHTVGEMTDPICIKLSHINYEFDDSMTSLINVIFCLRLKFNYE